MAVYQSSLRVSSNSIVNRLRLLEEIASQDLLDMTTTNDGIGNLVKLVIISINLSKFVLPPNHNILKTS